MPAIRTRVPRRGVQLAARQKAVGVEEGHGVPVDGELEDPELLADPFGVVEVGQDGHRHVDRKGAEQAAVGAGGQAGGRHRQRA
jgi:hypothetical protein